MTFLHDQSALTNGDYFTFDHLSALSMLNGAGGPHVFAPSVVRFMSGIKENVLVEELIEELPGDQAEVTAKLKGVNA